MYSYTFGGGFDNSYYFTTDLGIDYIVKFRPSPYVFGDEDVAYANYIYEFIIGVLYNPTEKQAGLDKNIEATVIEIFKDFYAKNDETICIYICDSSDGRQMVRHRKFNQWFVEHSQMFLLKLDEVIIDSNNIRYPISVLIRNDNPYAAQIVIAFGRMIREHSK